jgi:hypothetical protein
MLLLLLLPLLAPCTVQCAGLLWAQQQAAAVAVLLQLQ